MVERQRGQKVCRSVSILALGPQKGEEERCTGKKRFGNYSVVEGSIVPEGEGRLLIGVVTPSFDVSLNAPLGTFHQPRCPAQLFSLLLPPQFPSADHPTCLGAGIRHCLPSFR